MSNYNYKTFEDFVQAAHVQGLQDAWENRYRRTGRTTRTVLEAVKVCSKHNGDVTLRVVAHTISTAQSIGNRIKVLCSTLGVPHPALIVYGTSVQPLDAVSAKYVQVIDHTAHEVQPSMDASAFTPGFTLQYPTDFRFL